MKKYPIHLLEAFMAFCRSTNLVHAAHVLGLSQPALSRQLQQFELTIGEKIFTQEGRSKTLSPIGLALYERLQSTWKDYDLIVADVISEFSKAPQKPIKLYGPIELLELIAEKIDYPFPLSFVPTKSSIVASKITSEEICLGVTRVVPDNFQYMAKKLFDNIGHALVVPQAWKIGDLEYGQKLILQLKERPILSYSQEFLPLQSLITIMKYKITPEYYRVIPNWSVLFRNVEEGKGWTLAPTTLLPKRGRFHILPIPSLLSPKESYHLLFRKDLQRVPWMNLLIQNIISIYKNIE